MTGPGAVSSGLMLWLDAALSDSVEIGGGVRRWVDVSEQGNDVTQLVASQQPTHRASGINGLSVVRFAGGDDVLLGSNAFDLSVMEGFVVWQSSVAQSTTTKVAIVRNGDNFELDYSHASPATRNTVSAYFGNGVGWFESKFATPVLNTPYLWNFSLDSNSVLAGGKRRGRGGS